jgi:hypothetical protein
LLSAASLEKSTVYVSMLALNALDDLGAKVRPSLADIKALPQEVRPLPPRTGGYVPRLLEHILADTE